MKGYLGLTTVLLLTVCLAHTAGAAIINYEAENIEGDIWRYDYTIYSNTAFNFSGFTIQFDEPAGLAGFSDGDFALFDPDYAVAPNDWYSLALSPVMGSSHLSFYTFGGYMIDQGESLSGFSVYFSWFDQETIPGSQYYWFLNESLDDIEDSHGYTQGIPSEVPEPQTFMLLGTGVIGLAAYYRRNRKR